MTELQRDPAGASRFTTRGRNLKPGIFCNLKGNKKNTKQKEAGRKQMKQTFFGEILNMFFIKRGNLTLTFPPLSSVFQELHRELAWTDSWT